MLQIGSFLYLSIYFVKQTTKDGINCGPLCAFF
jgi:hypothetical protein